MTLPEGDVINKFSPDLKNVENPTPADQVIQLEPVPSRSPFSTFDEIACELEFYLKETSDLDAKLKASDTKIKQIEIENGKLIKLNHELRATIGNLENTVQNQRRHASSLERIVNGQKTELRNLHNAANSKKAKQRNQADQINGLHNLVHRQQQEHTATIDQYETLQGYTHKISEKAENLQLDLELLKCKTCGPQKAITTEESVGMMHLTPQPFVAVLIDGDAYASNELFGTRVVRCPRALAAIRLKNEVTRYISEDSNVPSSSKVVARTYINAGQQNQSKKRISFENHQLGLLEYFRVQFKNFHLLLSNPYCHRVFLAACTDNGFARMLEPYQYHTGAFEKIILFSPGYVEREIAPLGFRELCSSSIFAHRERGLPIHAKQQKQLLQQSATAQAKMEELVHNQRLGHGGVRNETAAKLVLDVVPIKWNGKSMTGGQKMRMGLQVYKSTYPADVKSIKNVHTLGEEGFEYDVGLE